MVVGSCDYKVEVKGNTKVYHANLLKSYTDRDQDHMEVVAVAIVGSELEEGGIINSENLLDLRSPDGTETFEDVQVSADFTQEQNDEVCALLVSFADIFTTNLAPQIWPGMSLLPPQKTHSG